MLVLDKYIATPEFNKLTKRHFAERLNQANLVSKNYITNFVILILAKVIQYFNKFLVILKHFETFSCNSKGMSEEIIKPSSTSGNSFAPKLIYIYAETKVKIKENYLVQDFISIDIVNVFYCL